MKSALKAACTVAALAVALPVAAQTSSAQQDSARDTSRTKNQAITLTGCLQRNDSGGFWLTNAKMSSTSHEPTGTSGTMPSTRATEPTRGATASNTWNLQNGHDLDKYVGHTIEVTGTPQSSTSGDTMKGTTGTTGTSGQEIQARDIDVKSIKSVASTCS